MRSTLTLFRLDLDPIKRRSVELAYMVFFGILPPLFVVLIPAFEQVEFLDPALFVLLQPQGQLFALLTGSRAPGLLALALAVILYGMMGFQLGRRVKAYERKKRYWLLGLALLLWEVILFLVAVIFAAVRLLDIT